jgi:ribosomal protein L11 methyltransferase
MVQQPTLWRVCLTASPAEIETFAEIFSEDAVAVTVLNPPRTELASLEALFAARPDAGEWTARLALSALMLGVASPALTIEEVPATDWLKKNARDFPPFGVGRWTIFSEHHKASVTRGPLTLQIDASSAFGTGEHPTTRGCLTMLDEVLNRASPRTMLDVGCGSGILALAFAAATRRSAVGVDIDQESVAVARRNAQLNGLQNYLTILKGDGYRLPEIRKRAPFDLIMANIFAGPLAQMSGSLERHLAPGGLAILSGLLSTQANRVIAAHRAQGLRLVRQQRLGEGSILLLSRT